MERASFLTDDEKRAAVGYGANAEGGDSATRPFARKYRADQARDEGGRWEDEGVGEDGEGGDNPDEGADPNVSPVQFRPGRPGWHEYTEGPTLVCRPELKCNEADMANYMARFAVPGQDPSKPVRDGDKSMVYDPRNGLPAGYVETSIAPSGLVIVNRTLFPHVLYDGKI